MLFSYLCVRIFEANSLRRCASRSTSLKTARARVTRGRFQNTKRPQMSVAFWLGQRSSLASSSDAQTPSEIRNAASPQAKDNHERILRRAARLVNGIHRRKSREVGRA